MSLPEPSPAGDVLVAFLSILYEGAPYILIGTLLSGFIDAFLPAKLLDRILPKNRVLATFSAGFLGLIFPVCECAVVPVVRRLVQKGLPLSCALTYLLSAPIVNPIVILSTATAFKEFTTWAELDWSTVQNATMTLSRISLGYAVAVIIGLLMIRRKPVDVLKPSVLAGMKSLNSAEGAASRSFDQKLVHAMRTSMNDFLDTAMYFTIGVILTSLFNTQVDQTQVEALASKDVVAIPSLMGLSFVLALCSTSDAFIAAPMDLFSQPAKLAFLVFGPMLDIKLVFMYAGIFRRRFMVTMCLLIFALVAVLSWPWVQMLLNLKPEVAS